MTMQIALCHENVLPERGGAEMYVGDFARHLVEAGNEVHLWACRWNADFLPKTLRVHPIPAIRGPRMFRPWRFSRAVSAELDGHRRLVSIGFDKTFGTDIYYPLGGLQAASASQNVAKHGSPVARFAARTAKWCDPVQWSYQRLERHALLGPNPPQLVVNSAMVRDHAARFYGIDPLRVQVIPNAIDRQRLDARDRAALRAQVRREYGIGPTDVVGAFVAMNYRLKGLEPLLHALARVPTFQPLKILVAGSPQLDRWRRMADRLGVSGRVAFIGPSADIRRVYFAADFHVHPTFYDPCSGVVLEALACGLPVITSRANGAAELVLPDAGFILDDPHDHAALAARLTDMMDPVRRDVAGRAARRAAGSWTLERHYSRWLDVFREVADQRRAA
jgi:UDP-glucose:(heptosyl)LPS alpha-1,3-glucosyltransferase